MFAQLGPYFAMTFSLRIYWQQGAEKVLWYFQSCCTWWYDRYEYNYDSLQHNLVKHWWQIMSIGAVEKFATKQGVCASNHT